MAVDGGVADRIGDLTGAYALGRILHRLEVLLWIHIRAEADHRCDALRDRLRRNDDDGLILDDILRLIGCEDDVLVIRKDEDRLCIDLIAGV